MTINLNGVEFYSAQEVEARIREALTGKDGKVNMEKLPIGTLVKVVGNRAGHWHEVGEILPITEVDMDVELSYRLDNKIGGWVSPRDIEFVSFPEEGVNMKKLPIGTLVKVVGNNAGHWHKEGEILPITEVNEGNLNALYRLDGRTAGWVAVKDIEFVSFPEEEESTSGDEGLTVDDLQVGDSVKFLVDHTDGYGDTVQKGQCETVLFIQDVDILVGTDVWQSVKHEDIPTVLTKIDGDEEEENPEIKAGDTVIATADELDITEGNEYEIKESKSGTLYFLDDDGDIRHVSVHEERLRKKSDKRGFKKGDIVYVNEEITDFCDDFIKSGVLTEIIEAEVTRGVRNPYGRAVMVEDGELDKLTLVCRAEDRLDNSKEDE